MKLTPLILFLILLFVLILSILFSKFLPLSGLSEGFVSFMNTKQPLDPVSIPVYSTNTTSVVKLYDNMFFDTKNANLIEVDGKAFVGNTVGGNVGNSVSANVGNVDSTGVTINGIYVVKRDGTVNVTQYSSTTTAPESAITSVSSQYNNWNYISKSNGTDKYQTFYFSWNDSTYIHIIDSSTKKHISSFLFGSGNTQSQFLWGNNVSVSVGIPANDTDGNNNTYVTDNNYNSSKKVYQISGTVKFDPNNGNIIIKKNSAMTGCTVSSSLTVYNRAGSGITDYQTNYQTSVANVNFAPWIIPDGANNMLVYMPVSNKTLIFILKYNASTQQFSVSNNNIFRFNSQGLDTGSQPAKVVDGSGNKDIGGDYYKWLAYWNTVANSPGNYSQDYLLKTQIVPPVCPSCPSCPHGGGACTQCGGQGGSGTQGVGMPIGVSGGTGAGAGAIGMSGAVMAGQDGSGNKQFDATSMGSGNFVTTANADTIGGATTLQTLGAVAGAEDVAKTGATAVGTVTKTGADVINKTVDTTGNVLTSAGSGATNLIGGTIGTAANLASSAGSGTVGLLKEAGSGTVGLVKSAGTGIEEAGEGAVGLLKDTASGAVGLIKDAGSGATKVLTQDQRRGQVYGQSYGQAYGQGTGQGTSQGTGPDTRTSQGQGRSGDRYKNGWMQAGAMQQGVNGVDLYSGYGALPNKGSDFIPITSDFSAFGK
jgi:hypothetical protein